MTGDPIEDLLKQTGKRPAVAEERRDRVRAAVHEVWKDDVAARARRRRVRTVAWLSAAALVLVFILVAGGFRSAPRPSGLTVSHAQGDAWTERGPWLNRSFDAVRDGAPIVAGALVTTDTHAKVALTGAAGSSIRLDGGTALRVDWAAHVELMRGALYVDTGGRGADLHIDTPFGTLEDLGTQFQARLTESRLVVRVREGQVTLRGRTRPATAGAGQAIMADGSKVTVAADPGREGWEWVEAAAPAIVIEGKSLADFVAWAARERGVRVRWTDATLETRAATIALHGSIDGMTLDQATASVMATAGVAYRWGDGELVLGEGS